MVQNGIFWTIGEQSYLVYYPIIYYRKIKVYSVETIYMGIPTGTMAFVGRISYP